MFVDPLSKLEAVPKRELEHAGTIQLADRLERLKGAWPDIGD